MGRQGRLGTVAESQAGQAGQLRIVEVERGGGGSAIEKTGVGLGLATREVRVAGLALALELGKLNSVSKWCRQRLESMAGAAL